MDEILQNPEFQIKLAELLAEDWFEIGICLKVKERSLNSIRSDFILFQKQKDKAYEMIKKWFNYDDNPTFEKLKLAILKIEKKDLLKEVKDLASGFSTTPSVLSKDISNTGNDKQFALTSKIVGRVGYFIGGKFDMFGRHLGLSQYDISNIDADKQNAQAKAVAVIDMWIEYNKISKWEQLKKELLLFKHENTVEEIEKEFGYK
ncbi:uncharacterized protein LOC136075123 [Hydra vulgaris]|uniref:Uncharacterized protein LOC136075123 n=1 Tax=Hydra vulgaris TaxID=6087 RepID=A0ABM4B3W7_HYDVU